MKKLSQKILITLGVLLASLSCASFANFQTVYANPNNTNNNSSTNNNTNNSTNGANGTNGGNTPGGNNGTPGGSTAGCEVMLGLVAWNCNVDSIESINSSSLLKKNLWQIVANIATDITVVAAYLVLAFVIYGGYLYLCSFGDPAKVTTGKRTIINAFIGLAIVLAANLIMGTIRAVLTTNGSFDNCIGIDAATGGVAAGTCADATTTIANMFSWVVGIAGLVSVIFIVIGGISYVTSAGNPDQIKKAKSTILYALIGLIIVALAEMLTAFITNIIKGSI